MQFIFWISALFGTIFFLLKTLFSFTGIFAENPDHPEIGTDSLNHGTDDAFKVVSLHSLTGSLMMFGWVGLACSIQHVLSPTLSIFIALLAGLLMMVVTAYLFKLASKLSSPGTSFSIESILNKTALVYQSIPDKGAGKIQVSVDNILREVKAISDKNEPIASFTQVRVVQIINKTTVSVRVI